MDKIVQARLREIEAQHNCRVLYACESGSRAWGFPSPDSDFDARFIYVHPRDWYLTINESKDSIEKMLPDDLDLAGWELRKTLRLFASCNLALNEWIGSPVVYEGGESTFREQLIRMIPDYFNPKKALHHYTRMAQGIYEAELADRTIKIKKLFYILRPLFACRWIHESMSMPPTSFPAMLGQGLAPAEIEDWIRELIAYKTEAKEAERTQLPSGAAQWLDASLASAIEKASERNFPKQSKSVGPLNAIMKGQVF